MRIYNEFEKCKGQLIKKSPRLTSEYFVKTFVGGSQNEIKETRRLLEPNLAQVLRLARYYEQTAKSQRSILPTETVTKQELQTL